MELTGDGGERGLDVERPGVLELLEGTLEVAVQDGVGPAVGGAVLVVEVLGGDWRGAW
ncbi:MAG: hypothetical protein HY329_22075 [Chloroflexi bacterium]|nr:hypothetical protein [Chloroflexota bacterium]